MYFAELLFPKRFVNMLSRRTYFVTSVLNLPEVSRENPLPL